MKRIISLVLVALMCLTLTACGSTNTTVEDICTQADALLVDFSKESFAFCYYEGSYEKIEGVYHYIVQATMSSEASNSEYVDFVAVDVSKKILEEVYPALTNLFLEFDVPVIIVVYDRQGNDYSAIYNGNVVYSD